MKISVLARVLVSSALAMQAASCTSPRSEILPPVDAGSSAGDAPLASPRDAPDGTPSDVAAAEVAAVSDGRLIIDMPPALPDAACSASQILCGSDCIASTACCPLTADCTPPRVVEVAPSQGYVASDVVFTVRFSKKMDPSAAAAITFQPALEVTPTWIENGTVVQLTPKPPVVPIASNLDPVLKLVIGADPRDSAGVSLGAAVSFNYKRWRTYKDQPCSLVETASVGAGYMSLVAADTMKAGTIGTNVPGRTIQYRGFATFACGSLLLQGAREILAARLVLKVETFGSPASSSLVIQSIPTQAMFTAASYSVMPLGGDLIVNANAPASWTLDVRTVVKLPEARNGFFAFRADTKASPTLTAFDGYDLVSQGAPQLLLDLVAP